MCSSRKCYFWVNLKRLNTHRRRKKIINEKMKVNCAKFEIKMEPNAAARTPFSVFLCLVFFATIVIHINLDVEDTNGFK